MASLPTELLRQIIEDSATPTFHSSTYPERQVTLRSLCLTSRRFLPIAQPLLYEIICVKSPHALNIVLENIEFRGGRDVIREASIADAHRESIEDDQLERLARNGLNLQKLLIDVGCSDFLDFQLLQNFPSLVHLRVFNIATLSQPVVLPKLESLSLCCHEPDVILLLLDPAVLPSLRQLNVLSLDDRGIECFARFQLGELAKQLEAISLHIEIAEAAPAYLVPAFPSTLFDCHVVNLLDYLEAMVDVQHLRICGLHGTSERKYFDRLPKFLSALASQAQISIRSIYLDNSLGSRSTSSRMGRQRVIKLMRLCRQKGIEVVFEGGQEDNGLDRFISSEFCRRQREQKRLQVA